MTLWGQRGQALVSLTLPQYEHEGYCYMSFRGVGFGVQSWFLHCSEIAGCMLVPGLHIQLVAMQGLITKKEQHQHIIC